MPVLRHRHVEGLGSQEHGVDAPVVFDVVDNEDSRERPCPCPNSFHPVDVTVEIADELAAATQDVEEVRDLEKTLRPERAAELADLAGQLNRMLDELEES